jgi:hypothetical protein
MVFRKVTILPFLFPLGKTQLDFAFQKSGVEKTGFVSQVLGEISMKRTELERRERELRKMEKKVKSVERGERESRSVGDYIEELFGLFRYDSAEIFNTMDDMAILELLENMKEEQPEKQWDVIIRKAVNKTKVVQKEKAYEELRELAGIVIAA